MNKERFFQITTEIRYFGIGKIEEIVEEHNVIRDENLRKKIQKLILDVCHGRDLCKAIGLTNNDYNFLPDNTIKRIKAYAILLSKEDPEFIFHYPIETELMEGRTLH